MSWSQHKLDGCRVPGQVYLQYLAWRETITHSTIYEYQAWFRSLCIASTRKATNIWCFSCIKEVLELVIRKVVPQVVIEYHCLGLLNGCVLLLAGHSNCEVLVRRASFMNQTVSCYISCGQGTEAHTMKRALRNLRSNREFIHMLQENWMKQEWAQIILIINNSFIMCLLYLEGGGLFLSLV